MSTTPFPEPVRRRSRRIRPQILFDAQAAQRSLPLVRRILTDLVAAQARRAFLARQPAGLGSERFARADEIASLDRRLSETREEIARLGARVLDSARGVVGFPTLVNGGLAYLVYRVEDTDLRDWRFIDQPRLRPIPAEWLGVAPIEELADEPLLVS